MGANQQDITNLLQDDCINMVPVLSKIRNSNVHEINKERNTFGEYHHLFPLLKKYPKKFEEYVRMQVATFEYILSKIDKSLKKKW